MNHFKNKRYWILMPPFFIIAVFFLLFLPSEYSDYALIPVIVYFITFTIWNYSAKTKNENSEGNDLS
ncbi:hypothetical protein [Salibacterium qingdaonense]|uniref:Uncharacterized protein n=1 Tax=Salibacterium qingdaonense TaxID=266892 RepID=A0A1I4NSR5_9BACI|nr:hypothetical protein [Salibacterium qingdaonense]SFM18445.1 hypothetical protein SAMN04488054_12024 [Salibacterium qingdaonense]